MKSAFLIVCCAAVMLASGCASDKNDKSKWDYTVISAADPNKTQKFNQLASEGWQLVDTDPYKGYLFKRAKQQ